MGLLPQADYLAELGVNAVELLPVFEYDELELQRWHRPAAAHGECLGLQPPQLHGTNEAGADGS